MQQDIHLFINGKEVEFSSTPSILYNYTETDFSSPAAVKNNFSKSITIEGTANNNDIFGHIWNVERVQAYSMGNNGFNPLQKADFVLYVNGEIYEKGYVKLDEVKMNKSKKQYSITLYGGLGSFFYNLMYSHNEEGVSDTPDKMSLFDLDFGTEYESEPDFSFRINKDTVYEAWNNLSSYVGDKWGIINFAPAYNGLPSDFDSDKCLINKNQLPNFIYSESGYTTVNGYALGTMSERMTEWETRDLRSYLQRPVIRMKAIIDACCNPVNNGGYEVKLDSHFFNPSYDYSNPYYERSWVTLPTLRELVKGEKEVVVADADLSVINKPKYNIDFETESFSEFTNVKFGMLVSFTPQQLESNPAFELFTDCQYEGNISKRGATYRVREYRRKGGIIAQLIALDAQNVVVGRSNTYFISTKNSNNFETFQSVWKYYGGIDAEVKKITGRFIYDAETGKYYLCDNAGNTQALGFSLITENPYERLQMIIMPVEDYFEKYRNGTTPLYMFDQVISSVKAELTYSDMFKEQNFIYYDGNKTLPEVQSAVGRTSGNFDYEIVDFNLIGNDVEDLFSNTLISKKDLLSHTDTPCDYLLSFCKLFNLYFYHDPTELSDDIEKYPNGVIHIADREDFYLRDKIVNLNDVIDRKKDIKIIPQVPTSKWYDFNIEQVESEVNQEYLDAHGIDYGCKRVSTSYNFDNEKVDVFDNNIFKGAIDVLETSKYYQASEEGLPVYAYNGLKYTLFKQTSEGYDTLDKDYTQKTIYDRTINPDNLKNTDAFLKIQLHGEDNDTIDGSNVLLFFDDFYTAEDDNSAYFITDDIHEMITLNDATPCWIMTASEYDIDDNRIAYKINSIPVFSRSLKPITAANKNIIKTWDLGTPDTTYVANTFVTFPMSIYDLCWKNYIEDMYSVDSRKLTCYCKLDNKPNPVWMRQFYWFDNSIWRLNSIKDWDIASNNTTLMEFIKVQDINNYSLVRLTDYGITEVQLDANHIGYKGGDIVGRVSLQDGGNWMWSDFWEVEYSNGSSEYISVTSSLVSVLRGSGNTEFTIHVPQNTRNYSRTIKVALSENYLELQDVYSIIKQDAIPLSFTLGTDTPSKPKPDKPIKPVIDTPIISGIGDIEEPKVEPDVEEIVTEPEKKEPVANNTFIDNAPTAYWVNREPPASVKSKNSMSAQLFNLFGEEGWVAYTG